MKEKNDPKLTRKIRNFLVSLNYCLRRGLEHGLMRVDRLTVVTRHVCSIYEIFLLCYLYTRSCMDNNVTDPQQLTQQIASSYVDDYMPPVTPTMSPVAPPVLPDLK